MEQIVWFRNLGRDDGPTAGGKGANLGELVQGGFPVPNGFVVTAGAYLAAMDAAGVREQLREGVRTADPDDATELAATADRLREFVEKAGMPQELGREILSAHDRLGAALV